MVIEKLETLETSLKRILEELEDLRRARSDWESQVEQARSEALSASEAVSGRDEEIAKLREENTRLQGERNEVRDRVERILNHLPNG
jgi:chromosome segregation ATPase